MIIFSGTAWCAGKMELVDLDSISDVSSLPVISAKVEKGTFEGRTSLRMFTHHTSAMGGGVVIENVMQGRTVVVDVSQFPGVALDAPDGYWDLSKYRFIAMDAINIGKADALLSCQVDSEGADGRKYSVHGDLWLRMGVTGTMYIQLFRKGPDVKLTGMRGYPIANPEYIEPTKITGIRIYSDNENGDHAFEFTNIQAVGTYTSPNPPLTTENFLPMIDTFGQYIHADWPGKVHSVEELKSRIQEEKEDLANHPGPADWDKYGGWAKGPLLKATGHFYVTKYAGKWWFVDPEGRLFFSNGIDSVGSTGSGPIAGREKYFQDPLWNDPNFKEFAGGGGRGGARPAGAPAAGAAQTLGRGQGRRQAGAPGAVPSPAAAQAVPQGGGQAQAAAPASQQRVSSFSFGSANLKRKYGDDWRKTWDSLAHTRLRSWGVNTISNWSAMSVTGLGKTPYAANLGYRATRIAGSEGFWGRFPDVFDPTFTDGMQEGFANSTENTYNDPWCIGYFVDNEMTWGDEEYLSLAALASPTDQAAKLAFIADLKAKYQTIDKLNKVWGMSYESWDAMVVSTKTPDKVKAHDDLVAFYTHLCDQYFRTIRDAIKAVAPNKLYLGCRYSSRNPITVAAACKYCDVVSYNLYRATMAGFGEPGDPDKARIIGEFHFGALDRGPFHTGLVPTLDQNDRAKSYERYVRSVLRNPQFVGCHWFQYQDEATTGRGDGENYQIGFVDIADTPYWETIAAARRVGENMYRYRMEK